MRLQLFNLFLFPFYGEVHCLNSYAQGSFHTATPALQTFFEEIWGWVELYKYIYIARVIGCTLQQNTFNDILWSLWYLQEKVIWGDAASEAHLQLTVRYQLSSFLLWMLRDKSSKAFYECWYILPTHMCEWGGVCKCEWMWGNTAWSEFLPH